MRAPSRSNALAALVALVIAVASAPALADLVFTSEPPTNAAVGQTYSYQMTAADVPRNPDDDDDSSGDGPGDDGSARRIRFVARALPRWLEFDGRDTISGTPGPQDIGVHQVRLRARVRGDRADQEFTITVAAGPPPGDTGGSGGGGTGGADLAASIDVTPNPASVGDAVTWTVTARNLGDADVANVVLATVFAEDEALGASPFTMDAVDDESCAVEPRGNQSAVVCRWSPLSRGSSRSVRVSGTASNAGEALATATVSIVDAVPTDRNAANDDARAVLRIDGGADGGAPDSTAGSPVLTLNGEPTIAITVGEAYQDPGATAIDDVDGDLTSQIVVDNPVDTSVIGRYSVTYDVVDSAGNLTTVTRTVEVLPREAAGGGGGGAGGGLLLLVSLACLARRAARCCSASSSLDRVAR